MQAEKIVGTLTGCILFLLSALHVYWAFGGKIGFLDALPEIEGKPSFMPSTGLTLLVALALLGFGILALWAGGILFIPNKTSSIFSLLLSLVFFGRAIGDFKLVGFFKRIKNTRFANQDYLYYSPLCVLLGSSYLFLGYKNF
ncbi:DUF3995 domain-containing protein [Leptospira sarikeiensis]|uniref:DUF3995 domain-containing protein n=1 Tax=Leptospira sarikeiensis TaxID=2484943 RepID=A0A4R9K073_9LEPT|nr:DUF3995 domain-containing protein [Leptospira sarikeiensis]TGL59033.1 DUF3995 domain-containing protein [Leptospira sarikeiensis]